MKLNFVLIAIFIVSQLLFSCGDWVDNGDAIEPSNQVTTEDRTVAGYDQLEVSSVFIVYVNFSDSEEKIEIEANENLHELIIVEKVGDRLKIRLKDNTSLKGNVTLKAYITTKEINEYYVSGTVIINQENKLIAEQVKIQMSGVTVFQGEIEANTLNTDLTGASKINLSGSTGTFNLSVSGASIIEDYNFVSNHLDAHLSGSSVVYLTVNEKVDLKASGASSLFYKGDAIIGDINLIGASKIKKVD